MRDHNIVFRNVLQKRDDYESKKKSLKKINFRYLGLAAACMVLVTVLAIGIPIMLSKKDDLRNYNYKADDCYVDYYFPGVDEKSNSANKSDHEITDPVNGPTDKTEEIDITSVNNPEEFDTPSVYVSEGAVKSYDWPVYDRLEELIDAATDIFSGKIIGTSRTAGDDRIKYLIYKIGVVKYYKGQSSEIQTLKVPIENDNDFEIGEGDYLFLAVRDPGDSNVLNIVNIDQYVFPVNSKEAQDIINALK